MCFSDAVLQTLVGTSGYLTSCCHSDLRSLTLVAIFSFWGRPVYILEGVVNMWKSQQTLQPTNNHVDHVQSHFNPLYGLSASHLLHVYKPECTDLLQLTIVNNNKVADELPVTYDMILLICQATVNFRTRVGRSLLFMSDYPNSVVLLQRGQLIRPEVKDSIPCREIFLSAAHFLNPFTTKKQQF